MSVELLELVKSNMPDKTGEASGWNFEKRTAFCTRYNFLSVIMLYKMLYNILCNRSEDHPVWLY